MMPPAEHPVRPSGSRGGGPRQDGGVKLEAKKGGHIGGSGVGGDIGDIPGVVMQGWVLKKKRKKMQGYARRWLVLDDQGWLSYSLGPGKGERDCIAVGGASVAFSSRHRAIHCDSGTSTYHLKILTPEDFDAWRRALRRFLVPSQGNDDMASWRRSTMFVASEEGNELVAVDLSELYGGMERVGKLLDEAEAKLAMMRREEETALASSTASKRSVHKDDKKKEQSKEKDSGGVFKMFYRSPSSSNIGTPTSESSAFHVPDASLPATEPVLRSLSDSISALRAEHISLTLFLNSTVLHASPPGSLASHSSISNGTVRPAGPFPTPSSPAFYSPALARVATNGTISARSARSLSFGAAAAATRRMTHKGSGNVSASSAMSPADSASLFFDAMSQGGEEHDIDMDDAGDQVEPSLMGVSANGGGSGSSMGDGASEKACKEGEGADAGGETTEADSDDELDVASPSSSIGKTPVIRRTRLPAPVTGEDIGLFGVLKKNVGKDLSQVSFPVSFNSPLSLLQAAAEEVEYADLFARAAAAKDDWVERMCFVAAACVSGYASTRLRASRKPFNPLLGETYELIREDKGFKFVAEKVSHHPPVIASYAEGKGWSRTEWTGVKSKFWGKSLELIPEGRCTVVFDDGEQVTITKPSSFMRNLLAGDKYLEHVGDLTIRSSRGSHCVLEFKASSLWSSSSSRNVVMGKVFDSHNSQVSVLQGRWNESLSRMFPGSGDKYQLLWTAEELPRDALDYYGFTTFAIQLNEMTPDLEPVLPPTDSRRRPDQRALENGDAETADHLKTSLEQAQRMRNRAREARHEAYHPRWFRRVDDGDSSEKGHWVFGGEYWEERKKVSQIARKRATTAAKEGGEKEEANEARAPKWEGVPEIFAPS